MVTVDGNDPDLDRPYLDGDEERTFPHPSTGAAVRFRTLRGGFAGTRSRFVVHLPTPDAYRGRCFHPTYPMHADEDAFASWVPFAITHGAVLVSANNDGGLPAAARLGGYRTNAASAKVARALVAQAYGDGAPFRAFLFGASGGAYQTIGGLENTEGVWAGGVPMVPGAPNAIPSFMASQLLGLRVLGDALPAVADALAPGGSGDPYAGLDDEQRAVLREVTRLGFPLRGWWQHAVLDGGAFSIVSGGVRALDPTYADDFWTRPEYEGAAPEVAAARVRHESTVVSVAAPDRIELAALPAGDFVGADLAVTGGEAEGTTLVVASAAGPVLTVQGGGGVPLRPGDPVRVDNSWNVALQYYARHQVPTDDEIGWDQYRGPDGRPVPAQRRVLTGPTFAAATCGSVPDGRFHGHMILVGAVLDVQAYPWSADWYAGRARAVRGTEALDHGFRIWFVDNADHDEPPTRHAQAHLVGYRGVTEQALLDLDRWVAEGVAPPRSTAYRVDDETQVEVRGTARERGGPQPVVTLTVGPDGGDCVEVATGDPVTFTASAEVPPGAGTIVDVEWDVKGTGDFERAPVGSARAASAVTAEHGYSEPGTYFPVVRVTAQREGDAATPFTRIQNLARVRVVVR